MFTGIIEEIGTVKEIRHSGDNSFIKIQAEKIFSDMHTGDSIAVNGLCLTVTEFNNNIFRADVMNETLKRSSLGSLKNGSPVNLERAMSAGGRFGGHIVSGHIDGTGIISDIKNDGIAIWYTVTTKPEIMRYIVEKGSIAIDGISLTVAKVTESNFSVSIIPHTAGNTILSYKKSGDIVNLENDIIGKYIEKFTRPEKNKSNISMNFLKENGFI
ncbi:MAG: riboflavin synthase [Prevotella sp.]|nr:riboflavin synthase [Alistipes senegalensis]MCM1358403.1 riboflavin synthase [Prevotella sp.]MCM1473795.1 riboflavin synthase [Muribaculaceae bacterium]